jgi:hypothetical protein
MTHPTHASTPVRTAEGDDAATDTEPRQRLVALGLLAAVVLNVALLSLAGILLVRRRRRVVVLVTGALLIGGWSSNLLDRLGMHTVTAPGSVRGAVDFIPLGRPYWNVADFVIMAATALYLVAVCARSGRVAATSRLMTPMTRPRTWGPRRASAGAGSHA